MATTLVIKGADFEANKLATVTLVDPVYCKGITLDRSNASLSAVGATVKLTAAVSKYYPDEPKLITKTGKASISVSDGVAIVPVPSVNGYPEIDAVAVCLMKVDYSTFTHEDFQKVQIEFLPAT